jgi:5-formyltetrahydrofolate cyclo-ligase
MWRTTPRCDALGVATFDRSPLRARRAALPRSVQRDAAAAVAARARRLDELTTAHLVGAYVPVRGEVDPWPIIVAARRRGSRVHLPVADASHPEHGLTWAPYEEGAVLTPGAFGIPTPTSTDLVDAQQLDVVLVPLVAFDRAGTRAGMGGGFYDRTFSFRLGAGAAATPRLIGLGYHWQQVEHLGRADWDVPLDAVVTDRSVLRFPGSRR